MMSLITDCISTVLVLNETKTLCIEILREAWAGAAIEEIPAIREAWGSAPRAGVPFPIHPVMNYAVSLVYSNR